MKKDYVIQGGVKNFLGQTEEVTAPKFWKSSPTSPDTELAYITDAEKGLLLEANLHGSLLDNKPNIGASGLLSFDGFGSTDPGQNRSGGDVSNTMDRGGDDGNDRFGSSTGGGSSFQGTSPDPQLPPGVTDRGNNVEDIDSTYTSTSFDVTPEKSAMDQLKDFISGGGIIGNTFKAISNFADNFNKNRRNKFMSTADIKEYELGTGKNWNPNNVTDKNSDEYKYLKNETNYFQQFNNDDNRNEDDLSTFFDDPQDATIQNFSNNPNPFSQVDNYFSNNMGTNNLGMSNNFMTSYNQAKADLAQSLNMTSNASQFGYNANMSASNIYYNYLKEQGLL